MKESEILLATEKAVKAAKGKISPSDLAAETGFALDQINDALKRLIELYNSKITMNSETGELQFSFDYPFTKRGSKSFGEHFTAFLMWFWKVFKIVYKASIAVILVVYTVVFAILLLVLLAGGRSDDKENKGGSVIVGIFRAIFEALYYRAAFRSVQYQTDPSGLKYKSFKTEKNKGKGFIQSVYSFVFGPERPKYNRLDDDKEVIAYIRQNNFKITASEIIELTGVSFAEADSRLAEYMSKYDGEAHITNDGILEVEFPRLQNQVTDVLEGGKIEFFKDEIEAPYELTGNTSGKNTLIIFLNIFNFIMSIVALNIAVVDIIDPTFLYAFSIFPLIFSFLFFLIPLLRIPYNKKMQKRRELNIIKKKLISVIFDAKGINLKERDSTEYAKLTEDEIKNSKKVLEEILIDLNGEINLNENGDAVYSFERIRNELK